MVDRYKFFYLTDKDTDMLTLTDSDTDTDTDTDKKKTNSYKALKILWNTLLGGQVGGCVDGWELWNYNQLSLSWSLSWRYFKGVTRD